MKPSLARTRAGAHRKVGRLRAVLALVGLGLFAVTGLGLAGEDAAAPDPVTASAKATTAVAAAPDTLAQAVARILEAPDGVTVLHFHATERCADCILIETYVRDYIEQVFGKELEAGSLHYRLINVDLPENLPAAEYYEIDDTMVVLTRWSDGQEQEWMALWEVWDFVEDSISLTTYVGDELITFLEAAAAAETEEAADR